MVGSDETVRELKATTQRSNHNKYVNIIWKNICLYMNLYISIVHKGRIEGQESKWAWTARAHLSFSQSDDQQRKKKKRKKKIENENQITNMWLHNKHTNCVIDVFVMFALEQKWIKQKTIQDERMNVHHW